MGCDIHLYLEYRERDSVHWTSFGRGFNPGRNYRLFAALAGVRGSPHEAVVKPRGIPTNLGWVAQEGYHLYVDDDEPPRESARSCSRANAEAWVARGFSRYSDAARRYVTHPDWHTPMLLLVNEFSEALRRADPAGVENEYGALLAAARYLELYSGTVVRFVLWFDN